MRYHIFKFSVQLPCQGTAILRDRQVSTIGQLVAESQFDVLVHQPIGPHAEFIGRADLPSDLEDDPTVTEIDGTVFPVIQLV